MRREFMMQTVAGDEGDRGRLAGRGGGVVEDGDRRGGGAPGGCRLEGCDGGEVCEFFEAGTAYDANANGSCGGPEFMLVEVRTQEVVVA